MEKLDTLFISIKKIKYAKLNNQRKWGSHSYILFFELPSYHLVKTWISNDYKNDFRELINASLVSKSIIKTIFTSITNRNIIDQKISITLSRSDLLFLPCFCRTRQASASMMASALQQKIGSFKNKKSYFYQNNITVCLFFMN